MPSLRNAAVIMTSIISLLMCLFAMPAYALETDGLDLLIWDDKPAEEWDVAYPVGNGRLGAMPFGNYPTVKELINEETNWARSGGYDMPA
jgi:alpha-L-fucosidase 2